MTRNALINGLGTPGNVGVSAFNGTGSLVVFSPVAPGLQCRVRASSYASGSASVSMTPVASTATPIVGGAVGITGTSAGTATSNFRIISINTTNSTNIKSSAGRLYYLWASNIASSVRYIKIFAKASAPTVGTDYPFHTWALPAGWAGVLVATDMGEFISPGVGFAITTGYGDLDTAATAFGEVFVNGVVI